MKLLSRLASLGERWIPAGAVGAARRLGLYPYGFAGVYASWGDAQRKVGRGYDDAAIAAHALAQLAAQRRDPTRPAPSDLRLLAALLHASDATGRDRISVIDFGGALGHHYLAVRPFLPRGSLVQWVVCETEAMCELGRTHMGGDELSFVSSLAALPADATVALASGSLQYVESPHQVLQRLGELAPWVIVDRLPLSACDRDRISLQTVPPWIYRARYPAWFFSASRWSAEHGDQTVLAWDADQRVFYQGEHIQLQGFLLHHR
jgi:putative methyltransferase (TIGR04325 family)